MSTNDQVVQNKRNLERILNFPFVTSVPLSKPDYTNSKTTTKAVIQGSTLKATRAHSDLQQLERLLTL